MRIYGKTNSHLLCGHWSGSPVEIGLTEIKVVPNGEAYHHHDYHEYYVILRGKAVLKVEGRDVPIESNTVVMVEPGERHRVAWVDPDEGIQWVIIKERSEPNSKTIVSE
jgi:mannose-6-phosphate isomerase-like protein (cupin superfamily)